MIRALAAALAAVLTSGTPAAAWFVIELADGGRIEASFVREADGKLYASRASGEIEIDGALVRSVTEVEPGRRLDEADRDGPARGGAAGDVERAGGASGSVADALRARERVIAREIIVGHRELLFARIRGDAAAAIEERQQALEELGRRRVELRQQLAPWERER